VNFSYSVIDVLTHTNYFAFRPIILALNVFDYSVVQRLINVLNVGLL